MSEDLTAESGPVTADDVVLAVRLAVDTLRTGVETGADWSAKAGSLEWDCWETVEHLADDLLQYASQLGPQTPALDRNIAFTWFPRRQGGPYNMVHVEREEGPGPAGLLEVLEACGALLAAMVRTTPPEVRSYHTFGVSDPEGFGAMGIVETLAHTHDVAGGLGLAWEPPADLCARVLHRLFPDVQAGPDAWSTLLWATGRMDLPGRPRRTSWRWDGTSRADKDPV
ncbi:hypothetical protein LHJ74_21890 [Streptomyces sp. N2-109]|uniref:Mycothiol-dependent maleylpyruvate isomerase metal-binding domain-containing protein n=1 Tax=Streptomyces gossypii TaxID=2883101 RepID=A0ABT2JXA5_9ACTN|nr:hypothetical protein [Streptomyces gossypii]MCT2592527.1 hypothetical protein [Streptomyces gossypii]